VVVPLTSPYRNFGGVLLLGDQLAASELLLQELLVGRAALRLASLAREEDVQVRQQRTDRLLNILDELALFDDMSEFSRTVIRRAADLVGATTGSLMLMDQQGNSLSIAAVLGMNPTLAQSLTVRVGKGIAGHVARSGQGIVVNDIGRDERFAIGRRPRFKTGSFLCVPLICRGETLGVLNLADRKDQTPFGAADLEVVAVVACHAAAHVRRVRACEGVQALERLSVTDPLTDLYNRRFLERRLEEEISRSTRFGSRLSLMVLDIDHFKDYNDLCGHLAGDKALKMIAEVLKRSVREMDVVTRFGGEEFCIILPDTPKTDALFVAERIRSGVEQELVPGAESMPLGRLTISIGVATYPEDGMAALELIHAADAALYRAKRGGRNRVVVAGSLAVAEGTFRPMARQPSLQVH
jgi:diguanylate cyclase (GGDEF)-like protein